jgi:hypothetical protein
MQAEMIEAVFDASTVLEPLPHARSPEISTESNMVVRIA